MYQPYTAGAVAQAGGVVKSLTYLLLVFMALGLEI
jgi:hypothetical protein